MREVMAPTRFFSKNGMGSDTNFGVQRLPDVAHGELAYLREKPDAPKGENALKQDDDKQTHGNEIDAKRAAVGQGNGPAIGRVDQLANHPRECHNGGAARKPAAPCR